VGQWTRTSDNEHSFSRSGSSGNSGKQHRQVRSLSGPDCPSYGSASLSNAAPSSRIPSHSALCFAPIRRYTSLADTFQLQRDVSSNGVSTVRVRGTSYSG